MKVISVSEIANALEKSSKQQIIYAAIAYEDFSYCLRLDLDLLLHTVNTSILCYEIIPKSAYALPYHSY